MVAIEFESVVKDKTIYLPEKYAEFDSQKVKVILMMNPKIPKKSRKKECLVLLKVKSSCPMTLNNPWMI
jgi:hypothetical protein